MKKIILSIAFLFCMHLAQAQEVQWAFRVLEYSSQKESRAFSANQVLGKPNVLPASGENMNAWQPKDNKKEEYIKVGFLNPMKPKQIVVAESFHPGGVFKIVVYDADGKEFNLKFAKIEKDRRVEQSNDGELFGNRFHCFCSKNIPKVDQSRTCCDRCYWDDSIRQADKNQAKSSRIYQIEHGGNYIATNGK
jgi:hypothetical protein